MENDTLYLCPERKDIMDKIVNGITYTKARFLRTTCKKCGKELSHSQIMQGSKFCNKQCRMKYKAPKKKYVSVETNDESDELCSSSCNSQPKL